MRRSSALIILAAVPLAIGGLVLLLARDAGLPRPARASLDRYVAFRGREGARLALRGVSPAQHPERFTEDLSARVVGDSTRFRVDANFDGALALPVDPLATQDLAAAAPAPAWGEIPVPFPPASLWCVALQPGSGAPELVFVAQHNDLYTGTWLIHEPAAGAEGRLPDLGCQA